MILFFHIAICTEGDIRLGIGNFTEFYTTIDNFEEYYFVENEVARGRIEVCIGEKYGTICDNNWSFNDASAICSYLGFSFHGNCIALLILFCFTSFSLHFRCCCCV